MDKDKNGISDKADSLNRYIAGWVCLFLAGLCVHMRLDPRVIITFAGCGTALIAEENITSIFKK
ncbi:MAG: hypothetical protein ACOCRU_03105 [bacterium]